MVTRVRFDRDLADPSFAWYSWESRAPASLALPAIGETLALPAIGNPLLSQ